MNSNMKNRYRAFRRGWGVYYCEDTQTGRQESLGTADKHEASCIIHARNEAEQHPAFSLHLARVYWKAGDPAAGTRTWQFVMEEILKTRTGDTRRRRQTAVKDRALDGLRPRVILETRAEHFLQALADGTVSTNLYLRRIHNFAMDMNWLPWPVIPKKQWPPVRFAPKRAITWDEHQQILAGERNDECRDYYEVLWHVGGSQTDMASLQAQDVDWPARVLRYSRRKTGSPARLHFGDAVEAILRRLPRSGPLFPMLSMWKESDRAKAFSRRCRLVGVTGVSLHSYRYAWAERAKVLGYPERFAQEALGHNSSAVHRAYARHAQVVLPSLESFEREAQALKIVSFPQRDGGGSVEERPPR